MSKEYNIVVCGSARVGKSTLINAICGREVAQVSSSLCSKTDQLKKYVINRVNTDSVDYKITIWDTPGVESWNKKYIEEYFTKIMVETNPICMIYCASPGSFARLEQLEWIIDTSIRSNIYCALVCTNKYSGGKQRRMEVSNEFHSILSKYRSMTKEEDNIKYYGNIALAASVNSIPYEDEDLGIRKDVEGVNELIYGILTSLKDDKLAAWCYTIADNDSFWSNMSQRLLEFYGIAQPFIQEFLKEHGKDIAQSLIPIILSFILKK